MNIKSCVDRHHVCRPIRRQRPKISSYLYSKYYHTMRFSLVTLFLSSLPDCFAEIILIFFFKWATNNDNKILQMKCYLSHNLSLLAKGMNTFQLQQHLNISVIAISLYQMYSRDTRWKEQKRKVAEPWGNRSMTTCIKFTKELQDKWLLTFRESSKLGEQSVFPVLQP